MRLDKWAVTAQEALQAALGIAGDVEASEVAPTHLLKALLDSNERNLRSILEKIGADPDTIATQVNQAISKAPKVSGAQIGIGNDLLKVINEAEKLATKLGDSYVTSEHLLTALANDNTDAGRILRDAGVTAKRVEEVYNELRGDERVTSQDAKPQFEALEQYGRNVTDLARQGKLDPVIGRVEEIRRTIQVLSRRTKNNPVLIGEPGVGKTAIVEGLAERIVSGDVPSTLRDKELVELDMSALVAGAKYRGEFEDRLKSVVKEVAKSNGQIILFIDELHTIVGAGASEGSMDAGNILKPALARGELRAIGATTLDEYRKYIEKDAALERRFQPITIEEPTEEESIKILEGIKERYEEHHQVVIEEEAILAAVKLSARYINDRYLPDKAIDLIDEAASKIRILNSGEPAAIKKLRAQIAEFEEEKEDCIRREDFEGASQIKKKQEQRRKRLSKELELWKTEREENRLHVRESDIAQVVSDWTKIPTKKLEETETERLKNLENLLHERVIGQNEAVKAVAQAIKRGRVGLKDPKRPIGSFMFLGPTGVGKTELSKAIAEVIFGSEQNLIRVDMSEYMEKYSVSKMIGSPPGYVGYDEGGQLSEKVRRNPYSVILFDEIEKAHPDVLNILLQVLDDGHITDSQGRKVSFKNTIIIMTSNAGAEQIISPKKLGFETTPGQLDKDYQYMKNKVLEELKNLFRPEFLNRIDEIIVFRPISTEDMSKILDILLSQLYKRAKGELDLGLRLDKGAKDFLVEKGYDPKFGARPLKRTIQTQVEDLLSEAILEGEIPQGSLVTVKMDRTGEKLKTSIRKRKEECQKV